MIKFWFQIYVFFSDCMDSFHITFPSFQYFSKILLPYHINIPYQYPTAATKCKIVGPFWTYIIKRKLANIFSVPLFHVLLVQSNLLYTFLYVYTNNRHYTDDHQGSSQQTYINNMNRRDLLITSLHISPSF